MHTQPDPSDTFSFGAILRGGWAGLAATAPMTAAMLLMERILPPAQRYPLPPEQIALRLAAEHGLLRHLKSKPLRLIASLALHCAFGWAAGALFALLGVRIPMPVGESPLRIAGRRVAPAESLRGIVFALGVWATSYLGWLPALGILRPATRHPAQRNILMIFAHVVWGAAAGFVLDWLADAKPPAPPRLPADESLTPPHAPPPSAAASTPATSQVPALPERGGAEESEPAPPSDC